MANQIEHRTFRVEKVRISFRDFFYVLFITTLLIVDWYVYFIGGVRNPWAFLIPIPICIAVAWTVAILFLRWRFPIRLEPESFVCCDWLCKYFPVPWESIHKVEIWPFLGLRYLRIHSTESPRPLWFPLNVEKSHQLRALFASYVDDDHPLAVALKNAV